MLRVCVELGRGHNPETVETSFERKEQVWVLRVRGGRNCPVLTRIKSRQLATALA